MSKELEALKRVVSEISHYKLHGIGNENWLGIQDVLKDVDTIEKALTPPTAEEVCKELNERYQSTIIQYISESKRFVYGSDMIPICWLKENNTIYWATNDLTPHLITLIGRFYEKEYHLTEREVEVLKALHTLNHEWLARDKNGELFAYVPKPHKLNTIWTAGRFAVTTPIDDDLFTFIKWTDKEPTNIKELLR